MNVFVNKPKVENTTKDRPVGKKVARPFAQLMSGNLLAREEVVRHLPFLFFLVFLGLIYIANGYMAEDAVRSINHINADLKELRSEYITSKSDLMYTSKQSELVKIIEERGLGLEESFAPPHKIVIDENEFETIED
tara:strand:+ start:306 stop:713 length:408 start_codon:yes stop_codon:yes gene_type:complete